MEQKQYLNISRLRDDDLPDFHVGDRIIVEGERLTVQIFLFAMMQRKIKMFSSAVELNFTRRILFLEHGNGHRSWIRKR